MINALFINACMMISFITIGYLVFSREKSHLQIPNTIYKVLLGIAAGFAGILLMSYSYHVTDSLIIDFRNFVIAISAIFGGPVAVILTVVIMFIYRMLFYGLTTVTLSFFISLLILSSGSLYIARKGKSFKAKWFLNFLLNMVVSTAFMYYWLRTESDLILLFLNYYVGSLVLVYLICRVLDAYIRLAGAYTRLTEESTTDYLTQLNNVRGFDIEFNKAINHCSRRNERLSFLMLDIDFFKKINDTYGHATGDEILVILSKILLATCRPFDIISRNGGEEFSVILQDCPMNHAMEVAERIRQAVESHTFTIKTLSINLTISIGVSSYPEMTEDPDVLIEYADKALYQAKQDGRNKVVMYTK